MQICTIVARNYLAAARVLARSFRVYHPTGTCWTLVVDDLDHKLDDAQEPFTLIRPEALAIDRWDEMTAGYSVLELSTAVKPWLLRHLLVDRDAEHIIYLDPDIQIFAPLTEVGDLLAEHAVVVSPHLTAAMPRDDLRPSETDILVSGSFNLGFGGFAAGEQVNELLDWWSERLATDCLVAPERGYFVDQRWMDLAPGLIPSLHVLRDPGYNVAYWNLTGRTLSSGENGIEVNGRPLRFFHFSGYDPDHSDQLSKHQNRIVLADHPLLRQLCDDYGEALALEGHEHWRRKPYAYGTLPDGTRLDAASRSVFRQAMKERALADERIFTAGGGLAFLEHLRGPATSGASQGVTRYLETLRNSRADLREAFPSLDGPDGSRLVAWAGIGTSEVQPTLALDALHTAGPAINVAGYLEGVMGVGEHARQLIKGLRGERIPVATVTLHPDAAPEDRELVDPEATSGLDPDAYFNLLSVNADMVPSVAAQLGDRFFAGRYTFGFWAWEVSAFPEAYWGAFEYLDEVWVGSRHVQAALEPHARIPVTVIPQPVSLPEDFPSAQPPPGLPPGFRFLFAFDYLSVFERKNPLAAVAAFTRAFAPGSGAVLIVKTLNSEHDRPSHERLRAAAAHHPDVHLLDGTLSADERNGLVNAADCYVSLHRAEGFGYTLAESMWAAKPVIATGYSGNLDYMTPANSYLVDHRRVSIGSGAGPYPADGEWADPDVDHAARLMREVVNNPDAARDRGRRAAADIRVSHSPDAAGRVMAERIAVVMGTDAWRTAQRGAGRPDPLDTDWVGGLIRSGPLASRRPPRFGSAQRVARRALLRAVKPVTAHERMVDGELLRAIEKLDANLRALGQAHAAAKRRIEALESELRDRRRT